MTLILRLRAALEERRPDSLLIGGDVVDPALPPDALPMPAAVLVPIVDRPEPGVILTLRPDTMRRHAGQIAFPGGRIDPGDDGPIGAALREAEEEIGLPRDKVEIVGATDPYKTFTGFEIVPVVGIIPPDLPLTPHPHEVAAVFEVPLRHLLDPEQQLIKTIDFQGELRSYYEIVWQDRRIWGATAAMIVNLSRRLARAA